MYFILLFIGDMPKVYIELDNLSREELIQLLFDKEEENKKLRDKADKLEKAVVKLMLETNYDGITVDWEVVIDMNNYEVINNKESKEEK